MLKLPKNQKALTFKTPRAFLPAERIPNGFLLSVSSIYYLISEF
jgi:hypothetical protein